MAEYIEREALVYDFEHCGADSATINAIVYRINLHNAADVAPVVHGVWKVGYTDKQNKTTGVECSECSAFYELDLFDFGLCYNYCPNCGARMDGE